MRYLLLFSIVFLVACAQNKEESSTQKESVQKTNTKLSLSTPDEMYPELFKRVQLESVFPDNKTFVDCRALASAEEINAAFRKRQGKDGFDLTTFVKEHFEIPPSISSDFKSDKSRTASEHVNSLWPVLTRKADANSKGSTLIPLPKDYIVPGGRFREVYYWDSYFTMLGLIEDGEFEMVENMLDNFEHLIDEIGHIPNGNRVYYKTRSQPPFFSQMVKILAEAKGKEILKKYEDAMKKEYAFWMNRAGNEMAFEHTVQTEMGVINRYWDKGVTPRQESFKEDFELEEKHGGGEKMYKDIRSGAESGWDFSSRWFMDKQNLHSIATTDILPIDLNALLFGLESILLELEEDETQKEPLQKSMEARKQFIAQKCWNEDGSYEDYNFITKQKMGIKSLAMMYPLFFKMVDQAQADQIAKTIQKNFLKPGGVVTSLHYTGQQWDAPNGWAPLQWITVKGLENYGHNDLAAEIAIRWVGVNERVYASTGKFVEKYNVEDMSLEAGGGEYPVQDGFGWSNGVYLAFKAFLKNKEGK